MAKLESLIVDMALETAELKKGLAEVKQQLKETSEAAEGLLNFEVLKEVGHLAIEAAEKLGEFALQGAEVADKMGKMAQSANISVESMSRLAYAGNLSKVSSEEMGVAFKKLNVNIAEAATGSRKQASLFEALGVSVKDAAGHTRAADVVMADLAETFSQMEEGPAKAALAVELFGKAGNQMLPFLNEGKEGLAKLSDEADRFGITLHDDTVKAATEFNDNLERMKAVAQGVATQVAAQLAPAMAELTKQFIEGKGRGDEFKATAVVIADALRVIVTVALGVVGQIRAVGVGLAGVAETAFLIMTGQFSAVRDVMGDVGDQVVAIEKETASQVEAVWKTAEKAMVLPELDLTKTRDPTKILQQVKDGAKDTSKEFAKWAEGIMKAAEELDKFIRKQDATLKQKVAGINDKAGAEQQSFDALGQSPAQAFAQATSGFKDFTDALKQATFFAVAREEKLTEAAKLEEEGGYTAAAAAREAAEYLGQMSQQADVAKEAFRKTAEEMQKLATDMKHTLGGLVGLELGKALGATSAGQFQAAGAIGNNVAGKSGELGKVASGAMQGFEAGGIWGAVIGALAELLSNSKQFAALIARFDEDLKTLSDALGEVLDTVQESATAFRPLVQAIGKVISVVIGLLNTLHGVGHIGDVLGPIVAVIQKILDPIIQIISSLTKMIESLHIFDMIVKLITSVFGFIGNLLSAVLGPIMRELGRVFQQIGNVLKPIFKVLSVIFDAISTVLDALSPIFGVIDSVVKAIQGLTSAFDPLNFVIKIITAILDIVALSILGTMNGIELLWGGILALVAKLLAAIGQDQAANDVFKLWQANDKNVQGIQAKMKEIWQNIGDTFSDAHDATGVEAKKGGKQKIPPGVLHGLDQLGKHAAAAAEKMAKLSESMTNVPSGFKIALARFNAANPVTASGAGVSPPPGVAVTVQGSILSEKQLMELIEKYTGRKQFQKRGMPGGK